MNRGKTRVVFAIVHPNADGYGSDGVSHIYMELKPSMIPNVGDYVSLPDENGHADNSPFNSYIIEDKKYVYSEYNGESYIHIHLRRGRKL